MPSPDDFAAAVHADNRLLLAHLNHHGALVEAQCHPVRALAAGDGPNALHAIVEGILQAVRVGMENPHRTCSTRRKIFICCVCLHEIYLHFGRVKFNGDE